MRIKLLPVFQGSEYRDRPTMKKQTTVKVTAMTTGTFGLSERKEQSQIKSWPVLCTVKKLKWQGRANLERPRVEGEAISVDEHPQGCQGDEEPASKGGKVDELVDLSGEYHHHHQGVLETDNTAMMTYSCGDVVTSKAPFTCTVHHFPSFIVFLANMSPTRWLC